MNSKKVLRIIDVNLNRCKEGLRVIEDIFRFILEDDHSRRKIRKIRHSLDAIIKKSDFRDKLLLSRNAAKDIGKEIDSLEMKRMNSSELFYSNLQRVKESLRVLEEFFKIIDKTEVKTIKKTRYKIYEIEKNAFKKWSSLRNFG
ncbi:MAG: thiamine-phosphate pyrophosphorylase [Candidatus Omnitrophica bacterium]|nr:thiamine-phosphate pyrophosphorylase [Candidatus Omnitrophota bacterium]